MDEPVGDNLGVRSQQQPEPPAADVNSRRDNWRLLRNQRYELLKKSRLQARKDCGIYATVCVGFFIVSRIAFALNHYHLHFDQALDVLGMLTTTAAVVTGIATCIKAVEMGALDVPPSPADKPETVAKKKDMWLLIKLGVIFFVAGQIAFVFADGVANTGPGPRPMDVLGAICSVTTIVLAGWAAVKSSQVWMS